MPKPITDDKVPKYEAPRLKPSWKSADRINLERQKICRAGRKGVNPKRGQPIVWFVSEWFGKPARASEVISLAGYGFCECQI